jgi:hypothetical protein
MGVGLAKKERKKRTAGPRDKNGLPFMILSNFDIESKGIWGDFKGDLGRIQGGI